MRALTGFRLDIFCLLVALLAALMVPALAHPSDSYLSEKAILQPPFSWWGRSNFFGTSVGIDGDFVIVGDSGYYYDDPYYALYAGSAHIYFNNNGIWEHQALLQSPDPDEEDWFGYSVAISGATAAVSIPFEDQSDDDNKGAVFIYERSGSTWNRVALLTTSDGIAGDKIGISLSLEGDVLAIGAPYADVGGVHNQGAVYIYVKPGSGWVDMTETAKMTASDGAEDDWFGNSVALQGEWLVVGAPQVSPSGMYSIGAVYAYQKPPSGWMTGTETKKLTAPIPANYEKFGTVIDLQGDILGVGCDNKDISEVTVYRLVSGDWVFDARLTTPGSIPDAAFGRAIAVGNDHILVGSFTYDSYIPDSGHAHLYGWNGIQWEYDSTLTPSDGVADDRFGWSAASDGTSFVVGATGAGEGNRGQAYIYAHGALLPDASVSIVPTTLELWEGGTAESYSVSLSTQPTRNVTITVEHDSQVSLSSTTLVFTPLNWDISQNVSVYAVQDILIEGDHSSEIEHTSASEDERYQELAIPSTNITIHERQYSLFLPLSMY
jgi:hypothetical protein